MLNGSNQGGRSEWVLPGSGSNPREKKTDPDSDPT